MGELLSLICRAPFPFSAVGLVLKRLPPPWNKRALAIVLIAVGILIVHPLVSPVRDFSLWLYYRVIPGPSVLVNFNNATGEIASIGKDFNFWISENQNNNRDNAINDIRAMPEGAITIPPDTNEPFRIRLPRDREIRRLYRGGGYLRLRFKVDEKDIEAENDCSKVISDGFSLVICDPNQWTSRPIALWFSEMEDSETNKDYLPDHVFKATHMITDALDVFEILAFEPSKRDPNRIVLNIMVGCYGTKEPGENELILEIEEKGGKVEIAEIGELYENPNKFESELYARKVIKRIRENILEGYPPRGKIKYLQPLSDDIPLSEINKQQREICLNIGYPTGVREGDVFNVLSQNQDKIIGKAEITQAMEQESSALLRYDSEEVKKGCRVKWKNAG